MDAITPRRIKKTSGTTDERSRKLVQGSGVAMVVSRGATEEVEIVNDKFTRLFGYTIEDMPNVERWWSMAYPHGAYRKAIKGEWQRRVAKAISKRAEIEPMEARVRCKDGSERYVEFHFSCLGDTNLVSFVDLTERRRAEEATFKHAAIVESSDDAIISKNLKGIITSWSKGAQNLFGYTDSEVIGRSITILIPPELLAEETRILEKLKAGDRIQHYETVRVTKTSEKIEVSLTISPVKDSTGKVVGASKIARDITQRKRAEQALRESEERLHLAIQAGKMYAYDWDVVTDVIARSPEYVNVLGATEPRTLTHQQVLGKVHPDDRSKLIAAVASHTPESPIVELTYRVLLSGKSPVWLKSSGRAFFDEKGRMLRVVGIVADITDQKMAEEALRASEERLRLAQRVAGIGTFERNIRTE